MPGLLQWNVELKRLFRFRRLFRMFVSKFRLSGLQSSNFGAFSVIPSLHDLANIDQTSSWLVQLTYSQLVEPAWSCKRGITGGSILIIKLPATWLRTCNVFSTAIWFQRLRTFSSHSTIHILIWRSTKLDLETICYLWHALYLYDMITERHGTEIGAAPGFQGWGGPGRVVVNFPLLPHPPSYI